MDIPELAQVVEIQAEESLFFLVIGSYIKEFGPRGSTERVHLQFMILKISLLAFCLASFSFAENNTPVSEILITNSSTYQKSKHVWKNIYGNLTQKGKTVRGATYLAPIKGNGYTDKLHKNGARNTIIFVPETTSFEDPVDLIFYFHGLGGFKKRDFQDRVLQHTKDVPKDKNYIIIIAEMPWSKNTMTPRTRQGRVFLKKKDFPLFVTSIFKITTSLFDPSPLRRDICMEKNTCSLKMGEVVLLGHSAGGSTLMSISRSGGLDWLCEQGAKKVKVIFSDASYGHWFDVTWRHFKNKNLDRVEILSLVRKWDKPHRHMKRFLKKFKKIPKNVKLVVFERKKTHAMIGDSSFEWIYGENEDGKSSRNN